MYCEILHDLKHTTKNVIKTLVMKIMILLSVMPQIEYSF